MFKTIRTIVFLLAWIPLAAFAADPPVSEADLAAYKELAQTKLDAAKESLQKDREKVEARLDAQDKRIGDLNSSLTEFGYLLTFLVLVAGVASWFSARDRAREEAREAAKKWFEEKAGEMEREIVVLRQSVKGSHDLIEKLKREAESHFQSVTDDVREKAAAYIAEMQKDIGNSSGKTALGEASSVKGKDGEALEQLEQALRHKPETEYGFDDWNTRAFSARHKDDFEGAARYWKSAAQAADATNFQIAQSLFNAGVALGRMDRSEDAVAVYDEVEKRFGDAPEAALRELVASALVNKGVSLGHLKRNEEAIAVCDEVDKRFGTALEAALREPVAKALVNKGIALGEMNRNEEKIAVCDEVVKRYGDAPKVGLRKQVARALNGKGFALLCRAKECWAEEATRRANLQEAEALFERAIGDNEDKPVVWGNQAYAAFLLGRPEAARPLLKQALEQGGERLYKGTLDDLDIHPVPPDAEFRAMLEESWAEVKPRSQE